MHWESKQTITVHTYSKDILNKLQKTTYRSNKSAKPHKNITISVERINKQADIEFEQHMKDEDLQQYEETFEKCLQDIEEKQEAKRKAKKQIKTKFITGHIYKLAYRTNDKYYKQRIFKLIKFIYTINNEPVYILIMKSLDDEHYHKFALNKNECLKYHIKYQPGLEVYSMNLNWIDVTNKMN